MWKYPNLATPSIIQLDFGTWGQDLPGDGREYCAPTSVVMGLYWLSANGFTQVAPQTYAGQGPGTPATNLELVIAGLAQTSALGGTLGGLKAGVETYLSACGIASTQYVFAGSDNPNLEWIYNQISPNWSEAAGPIVLANFSVGWYSVDQSTMTLTNHGGHVVVPLTMGLVPGTIFVNNPAPSSFVEGALNQSSSNPQMVAIASVPSNWTFSPPRSLPSQDYSQVVTGKLGLEQCTVAVLWGSLAWAISTSALPSSSDYQLCPWVIADTTSINTNGGVLTVIAPLSGTGGLSKSGEGTLQLTNTNQSTGANSVSGGVLASTQSSGTPFGTGAITLSAGGILQFSPNGAAAIASASDVNFTIGDGGGTLQLSGTEPYVVTVGGYIDQATPNIDRATAGTLIIAPGGGIAQLGSQQQVIVAGSAGNLPVVAGNGIVAPYILGQDDDENSSGAFLTYDAKAGFEPVATTSSQKVGINKAQAGDIYEVVDDQTIMQNATVEIAALEINGGEIDGVGSTLAVGSQASGDYAGIIMNGGLIEVGTLAIGDAEGLIYTSDTQAGTAIGATVSGSQGLTTFGPGALFLGGDNSQSLAGQITVNSGTLIVGGVMGSATGSGDVDVNGGATLQVLGTVAGGVNVAQSGVLYMSGGTVQGSLIIQSVGQTTDLPGGILQGNGTIAGPATFGGVIQSGADAGTIAFTNDVTISSDSIFYWRLQGPVDNTDSGPGVGWNALQFGSHGTVIGSQAQPIVFLLDFSVIEGGDPDGGNPFWQTAHTWTLFTFESGGTCWPGRGNFTYQAGQFAVVWMPPTFCLTWTPASSGGGQTA